MTEVLSLKIKNKKRKEKGSHCLSMRGEGRWSDKATRGMEGGFTLNESAVAASRLHQVVGGS